MGFWSKVRKALNFTAKAAEAAAPFVAKSHPEIAAGMTIGGGLVEKVTETKVETPQGTVTVTTTETKAEEQGK